MLEKIIRWAERESFIQVVILQGSRATLDPIHDLSDYDLAVFCTNFEPYTQSESWLTKIAPPWVCVKEKISFLNKTFPTRLVIFEGGLKVDFSFFTVNVLEDILAKKTLPEDYQKGYKVLVDKKGLTTHLQNPSFQKQNTHPPSKEEFCQVIEEFWFEAYHVAVYLHRKELWAVKFRTFTMHTFLLKMIEWQAEIKTHLKTPPLGKAMATWADKATYDSLHKVFAHFDAEDSSTALLHTLTLFRKLATEVASNFKFNYPESIDKNITGFILNLQRQS